ncbi:MAG: hypothetical protein M1400_01880 [Patescibacteria group bacterium]|nr:hypothetical protein [Patescibacteria group bacterium]
MFKYHKLISLFIGLLFLAVLQTYSRPVPVFRLLVAAFLIYVAAVGLYNRKYLQAADRYTFWGLVRPALLAASGLGIFFFLPSEGLRNLFLLVSVGTIFLFEVFLGNFSENFLVSEILVVAFGLFLSLAGLDFYFPSFGDAGAGGFSLQPLYLAGVFLIVYLLSRSLYEYTPLNSAQKNLAAAVMGIFCTQLFWSLSFLPLHFTAAAFLLLNFFYLCLMLYYYQIFNTLNLKKIYFHFGLFAVCASLVLLTTPWKVI